MVCTISGLCSDSVLLELDSDTDEEEAELEAEILTEKGRFGTYLSLSFFPILLFPFILLISNM